MASSPITGHWSSRVLVSCRASTSICRRCRKASTFSIRERMEFTFHVAMRMRPSLGGLGEAAVLAVDSPPVALTIGIVGLPNAGKSTLLNALTKNDVLAANSPFATIEPSVGVVGAPEPRLQELAELFGSARILP